MESTTNTKPQQNKTKRELCVYFLGYKYNIRLEIYARFQELMVIYEWIHITLNVIRLI